MFRDGAARAITGDAGGSVDFGSGLSNFRRSHSAAIQPKWQASVLMKVTELLSLRPGWDSYSAPVLKHDAAMFAMIVLQNVMKPGTPEPSVVPSSTGGVQLEWHVKDIDLEIHVLAPYQGEIWWCDRATGHESSVQLSKDLSVLSEPINKMSA
ncbi:MAG: hypothetical protein AAB403_20960 [Planctomycetota bacterium]